MATGSRFSERHGYEPSERPITVRQDAPHELRGVLVDFAYEAGLDPHRMRSIVCRVLMTREDPSNWTPFPNVDNEVRHLVDGCEWYEVYDIIEATYDSLASREAAGAEPFATTVNTYFERKGIGWQLVDGRVELRGPEAFESSVRRAHDSLESIGLGTASSEIHQALADLSRRPNPDVTGAIQHALAGLECVVREATGETATLGKILERHRGIFPPPLDIAVEKMWGYASEHGRHLREGRLPTMDEAQLIVSVSAAAAQYLSAKLEPRQGE